MSTIVFHGRVLPERADFNVASGPFSWTVNGPGGPINCSISIIKSMVSVTCLTKDNSIDLTTLRNIVTSSAITLVTDAYGVESGTGYEVEIISATNLDSGSHQVFGVDAPIDVGARFPEIAKVVSLMGTDLQLRSAIASFREAIRRPEETVFYCYRAVEAVKGHFLLSGDGVRDDVAWKQTRDSLNLKVATLVEFKSIADQMRHGIVVPQSWTQRKRQLEIAREVVRRFAHFLADDKTELKSEEFPEY